MERERRSDAFNINNDSAVILCRIGWRCGCLVIYLLHLSLLFRLSCHWFISMAFVVIINDWMTDILFNLYWTNSGVHPKLLYQTNSQLRHITFYFTVHCVIAVNFTTPAYHCKNWFKILVRGVYQRNISSYISLFVCVLRFIAGFTSSFLMLVLVRWIVDVCRSHSFRLSKIFTIYVVSIFVWVKEGYISLLFYIGISRSRIPGTIFIPWHTTELTTSDTHLQRN